MRYSRSISQFIDSYLPVFENQFPSDYDISPIGCGQTSPAMTQVFDRLYTIFELIKLVFYLCWR